MTAETGFFKNIFIWRNALENAPAFMYTDYVAIEKSRGTGKYNFTLSFTSANESFLETAGGVNNSVADATEISTGTTYYGQLACNDSKDIYKFTLAESCKIRICVKAFIPRTDYYIYDINGSRVWKDTWNEWNSTTKEMNLDVDVDLTSGTYYFAVEQGSGTGNYSFSIKEPGDLAVPGDVDGSGEVDTVDAIRLAKYLVDLVELTDEQKKAADVTGDDDVTTTDAIRLAKYLVGLIETLRPEPAKASPRAAAR